VAELKDLSGIWERLRAIYAKETSRFKPDGISMRSRLHSPKSVLVIAWLLCSSAYGGQQIEVRSVPFEFDGVEIHAPNDQSFEPGIRTLLGDKAARVFPLKPYLALVSNRTKNTIVAYSVVWTLSVERKHDPSAADRKLNLVIKMKCPDAVAGHSCVNGEQIGPGESSVITPRFDAGKWALEPGGEDFLEEQAKSLEATFPTVTEMEVSLDAVIFDDGTLIGRDEQNLAQDFASDFNAHQALYRKIVSDIRGGATADEVFAQLMVSVAAKQKTLSGPNGIVVLYDIVAAQEALAWRSENDDRQILDHFSGLLRNSPFTLKRLNTLQH
jgi:hypothetical protein